MAVEIEFVSVIVLKSWSSANYPGGLDAYAGDSPTQYLEDEHISRVGFMSTREAEDFYDSLGVDPSNGAILCRGDDVPGWLMCGIHQGRGAAWKATEPPGDLVGSESLMVRGMGALLPQPGWMERVIKA